MRKGMIAVIAIVGLIVAGLAYRSNQYTSTTDTTASPTPTTNIESAATAAPVVLTATEVAKHATAADCWTIIAGNVYNLTTYISRHPGGDAIAMACGRDGTIMFQERMTDDGEPIGSGQAHSTQAESQLSNLKMGPVADVTPSPLP